MSFWFKARQVVVMDAHGGRPARNFYVRMVTIAVFLILLMVAPFVLGAWYAPFHSIQEVIPENLKLKRENQELKRSLADAKTVENLKDEQLESLQDQMGVRARETLVLTKELHMFKSILEERKGKGIQIITHKAHWLDADTVSWEALFVKGGTYPRYLSGSYDLFALDNEGNRKVMNEKKITYRFESHTIASQNIEWQEPWKPTKIQLIIYNYRKKEVLKQTIQIEGI